MLTCKAKLRPSRPMSLSLRDAWMLSARKPSVTGRPPVNRLSEKERTAVMLAIEEVRATKHPYILAPTRDSVVSAYPSKNGITWRVEKLGTCVARGVEK
jgi:hypothetical protein